MKWSGSSGRRSVWVCGSWQPDRAYLSEHMRQGNEPPVRVGKDHPVWEQAADALDAAEEAEDFQAVGMRCRETLIRMVRALAKPSMVPHGEAAPKRSDVVNWSSLIANTVAGGQHNDAIRGHLKALAKSTWDLANWLTHASGAKRIDAVFVSDATRTVLDNFGTATIRHESGSPEQCPECGSYAVEVEFDPDLMPDPYFSLCGHCGCERQAKGMN